MKLQFHHRKLIEDKIKEVCESLCDSSDDPDFCASPCLNFCPENCNYSPYLTHPPPPPPPPHQSLRHSSKARKFLIVSAVLLAAAFLALCCYAVYVKLYLGWYRGRRRSRSDPQTINQTHDDFLDEDRGPAVDHHVWYIQTVGLQPSVIGAITVCKYKSGDGLVEGTECSVCLNEFQEDETLRLLPKCNHAFHLPCIDTWLTSHTNCPMCRAPIVKNSASDADNSASGAESGDAQIEVSEESGETETRLGDEEVFEEERVGNTDQKDDHEMQPMRRSVSLDFLSASKISRALANPNAQLGEEDTDSRTETVPKPVNDRSDSLARFVATSSSVRRSLSCSGKFFLSRNSYCRGDSN